MINLHELLKFVAVILITIIPEVKSVYAQTKQKIRGKVVDDITNAPLIGVNVIVINPGQDLTGSTTGVDGDFRIDNVALGRKNIKVTCIGYEEQVIPNVIVTAGKEVILNVRMTESVSQLDEVVVTADSKFDKTATNNDMAVVSSRSFNVDDTKRYAGSIGDPSRMAANFAGVVGGNDSRNDIVVRGNSPIGMLWQLEGLNIPNPNHFGALVSTGGPVSMLNNNNLDKSDFMTGAFPAQYGNASAGVFDIKVREGNNQTREFVGQVGFNGFELGAEGPISPRSKGSYIINYRYSTLGIFDALGLELGTDNAVPVYQDVNFKISLPAGKNGKLHVFGVGGLSDVDLLGSEADLGDDNRLYGSENTDTYTSYRTGVAGVSYEKNISSRTFAKVTLGTSVTNENWSVDSLVRNNENEVIERHLWREADMSSLKYSLSALARTKFNARNSLVSGFSIDRTDADLFYRSVYANVNRDTIHLDVNDNTTLYQLFSSWKHRFNGQFSLIAGVHAQYYDLAGEWAVEPRASFQYSINANHALSVGYGLHNQVQHITTSFTQTKDENGNTIMTNKDLGHTTSQHLVLTYDWFMSESTRLKTEFYYQHLDNIPVEQKASSFSAINLGSEFVPSGEDSLVNGGTGRNFGMELTLERFFNKGYYYLLTASLFDSRYKGSDGIERNTTFNTNHVLNILAGKEWQIGSNGKFIGVSLKLTSIGGKYLTPIDFAKSQQLGRTVYTNSKAYSERQDPYFRADVKFSYRKEYKRSTLELSLDLQNVTNNENIFSRSYNPRTNEVITQYQQLFFPVPFVRLTF